MAQLGLTDDYLRFAVAINLYTREDAIVAAHAMPDGRTAALYKFVNLTMRVPERQQLGAPGGVSANLERCLPYIKLLDEALRTLPDRFVVTAGQVHRGVKYVYPSPQDHDPVRYFASGHTLF